MKVSLIMPTINVTEELDLFLKSLSEQTYKDFELIAIDQNTGNEAFEIIRKYEDDFEIKYMKSNQSGLSLNRNKGLIMMDGDIVGFPDDDCEYEKDTLEKVVAFFKENKDKRIYSCRTLERGKDYGTGIMLENNDELKVDNIDMTVKSITFFVNYSLEDITLFDENLGVGAYFGSGEETDYVLTLLHKGFKGNYFADDIIYHPAKKGNYDDLERAYKYALGYGALVKKEVKCRKNFFYIFKYWKKLFRNIGGMIVTKNRKYHWFVLKGRLRGYFRYKCQG
ncbi:glycosyltransferase family 2 protein [Pseudoleptotrichia goodfellowii]|uniref:Glycosyltransferase, group 2 family protein n=1 Tax=Pseudoleptotrichia goodfellowii F0264 TaxID=596323 RepID=D0GJS0_9FUSO|nr:glycosyltransferase family 2 protein [Pseudoleptotrichia goodfellowii]EEY35630.1 glycosyltransferase, group 2 family protein [Pseudoleptotrichia goodfellowii F0264]